MRRRFFAIWAFCVFSTLLAEHAAAQDSQARSFTLSGQAQATCGFSAPQSTRSSNMTLAAGSANQSVINITSLLDGNTALLQAGSISLTLKGLCNRAHSLSLTTANGGLRPPGGTAAPVSAGFASRIDYTAQVSWAAASASLHTSGVQGEATPVSLTPGAYSGNLLLQIFIDASGAGNLPLNAGTYMDKLTVTLAPQL